MKGTTRRRQRLQSGLGRLLASGGAIAFSLLLALPIATLVLVSFSRDGSWTTETLPPAYTLSNFARIATDVDQRSVFVNSLLMAGIATLAALVWSFCVTALTATGQRVAGNNSLMSWWLPRALRGTVVAVSHR